MGTSPTTASTNTLTSTPTKSKTNTSWSRPLTVPLPTPAPTNTPCLSTSSRTPATNEMENGTQQPSNYLLLNFTASQSQTLRSDTPNQPARNTSQRSRSSLDQSAFLEEEEKDTKTRKIIYARNAW